MRQVLLRVGALLVSIALFVAVLSYAGIGPMGRALLRVAHVLPLVLLLELLIIAANAQALRTLYRAAASTDGAPLPIPPRVFWRTVYLGNIFTFLPAGRLITEGWKAVRLSRYIGAANAAAGAVGCQAAVLLGNAFIAALTLVAVALRCGATWPTAAVALFSVGMLGMGGSVLILRTVRLGRFLGARMSSVEAHGEQFDQAFVRAARSLWTAAGFESLARVVQLVQVGILLWAASQHVGVIGTLATYGLVLVGAALGDMLPAQVGATDAMLTIAAQHVGLSVGEALAMTVCLHGAQVGGTLFGSAIAFLVPTPPLPQPPAAAVDAAAAPTPPQKDSP